MQLKPILTAVAVLLSLSAMAQPATPPAPNPAASTFETLADAALQALTKRAEELKIKGVGVVAFIPAEPVTTWSSKMTVVGTLTNPPSGNNRGANLLAIAYTKAAEMADTLKNSGTSGRQPMTGETGWQGGLIRKGKTGYLLAAFSGGPAEDDLKAAQAALDVLASKL